MFSKRNRYVLSALLGASLLASTATSAPAAEPVAAAADLVFVRPVALAGTVLGTSAYIVSLPVTYAQGTSQQVGEDLVMKPFRFTVTRPLGELY